METVSSFSQQLVEEVDWEGKWDEIKEMEEAALSQALLDFSSGTGADKIKKAAARITLIMQAANEVAKLKKALRVSIFEREGVHSCQSHVDLASALEQFLTSRPIKQAN